MMNRKINLSFWLVAVLAIFLVIAGCSSDGNNNNQTNQSGGSTSSSQTGSTDSDASASPEEKPVISATVYDRGGRVAPSEGTLEDNRWTKWINEVGPVQVEYVSVPRGDAVSVLNTLFASSSAPDVIFEYDAPFKHALYTQKQLKPLDEYIEQYSTFYKNLLEEYPILRKAGTMDDGQLYVYGRLKEVVPIMSISIRQDWLDKLGLNMPETTEELFEVARAFTFDDPDNNGEDDTYGIALRGRSSEVIDHIFQNVGWVIRDGRVEYAWDNMAEATEFKKRLYDEGIVDPNFLNSPTDPADTFAQGKLGILPDYTNWQMYAIGGLPALLENDPDAVVNPMPFPRSTAGQFNPRPDNPVQMNGIVNANAENMKAVIEFLDFQTDIQYTKVLEFGHEGEHHELNDQGCPVFIDAEKANTEVSSYAREYRMLESAVLDEQCGLTEHKFNLDDPNGVEGLRMWREVQKAYLDTSRPLAEITHPEHMPSLPREEALIASTVEKQVEDLMMKAIISGSSYTVQDAIDEAQDLWKRGGGDKLEAWYQNWYENDSHNAILAADIYEILEQQLGQ